MHTSFGEIIKVWQVLEIVKTFPEIPKFNKKKYEAKIRRCK